MRRMALSSVDSLMFFRWRPAHFGTEIYWIGIIDHDDQPRRCYVEATQFGADIAAGQARRTGSAMVMVIENLCASMDQ